MSRYSNPVLDWLQAKFMAWESGAYLKGPIRTRRYIAAQGTVLGSFQIWIGNLPYQVPQYFALGFCPTSARVIPVSMYSPISPGMPQLEHVHLQ